MKESLQAVGMICYTIFGIMFVFCITLGLYYVGFEDGEKRIVQELCERKQYDFCEVIIPKPEYKLKELKQDD